MTILVTGGAGFIGSHLVRALLEAGHRVRILDGLVAQVHGPAWARGWRPPDGAEVVYGNVVRPDVCRRALAGCEAVVHLAAEVGVGQSMYEIARYVSANALGTAVLLEQLIAARPKVRRLVVASSMSIYGEGAYACAACGPAAPAPRGLAQLERREWELRCPGCGATLSPVATPEDKPLQPTSVYAVSKRDQEELCLAVGRAYGVPAVALRFFNVYGPGQALSNPYTGVAAIFAARLLNGHAPLVFEDGRQSRDLVHVSDVVAAIRLALTSDAAAGHAINIGSGEPRTVLDLARGLAAGLGVDIAPEVVGRYREGDIRHCYADIDKARRLLGYAPRADFGARLAELADWVRSQTATDHVAQATAELDRRGLTR